MKALWTVARRELKALFDNPAGYVLLIVFLVVNAFLYFRQAYPTGAATLRPMLDVLPWLLLFFVPAVAMRALAEDARMGQLEVVLSQPITEFQLLLGKYLGATMFLWIALLVTLPIPLGLSLGSALPWGPVVAQYVGAMLLAGGLAGVGVWASGITRSQITAFIVAVAVMFVLVLVGLNPLVVGLPPELGLIAARLGVLSHFDNIGRGVIDLRDVVYFVSLAALFLTLAYGSLMRRKLAGGHPPVRRLRLGVTLLVATLVVINLLGSYITGRLDLTPGHAYTLSPATRNLVRSLPDIVTIKVFASEELPAEVGLLKRDVDDMLSDIRSAGRGKVRVVEKDPGQDPAARQEAQSLGITPVQFNVVGQGSLQVKEGYLGLVVQYADGNEPIPFIRRTDDLEYRLASAIQGLTRTSKRKIGLVSTAAPYGGQGRSFGLIQQQLAKSYQVMPLSLGDSAFLSDTGITALIIAGEPDSLPTTARTRLTAFLQRGGSALLMASGAPVSGQLPRASAKAPVWNGVIQPFGVKVRADMVYDLSSNQIVPMPTEGGGQVLQPYPFFLRSQANPGAVVTEGIGEIFLPWASSIDTSGARPGSVTPLLRTSRAAGVAEGEIDLNPSRMFPREDLKSRLMGVMVQPAAKDTAGPRGRLIVVGNSDFATDRYVQGSPENGIFALNAVDWLAQDEALISIRSRDREPPRLLFSSKALQEGVKYANVILVPALIGLLGVVRLVGRRRRALEPWRPLSGAAVEAA
jgi:gliding motility-associatede transport system auxiliary component